MISTKGERIHKARLLIMTLLDVRADLRYAGYSQKRPHSLPAGVNYSCKEWVLIQRVLSNLKSGMDVSILWIFDLEELEEKYRDYLMLAKFEN